MDNDAKPNDHCQDSEYILYDVLDDIFRHLTIKSLRNVALVSRSWNHAAKREISKREPGPLCRALLPVLYDAKEENARFEVNDHFVAKPNTVIMFCGPRPNMRPVLGLEYKIMGEYHRRLPGRIVMLGVDHAMLDATEVRSCKMPSFCSSDKPTLCDSIVGLCLPDSEDFTIKLAECVSHEKNTQRKAEKIFDKLHESAERLDNPIFLLFSRYDYTIGRHVLKMFREKYASKPLNVWGGTIGDFIKRSDDGYPDYRGTHGFLGILLQGARLRAHSIVLPIDDDASMSSRLSDFRHGLRLKRRSLGLVCGPRESARSGDGNDRQAPASRKTYHPDELMTLLKRHFPRIDFTGMFNDPDFHYYGCDHTSKNGDYSLEHKGALSIMILTYD